MAVGNSQITQVAAGTVGTDAVNLNQLNVVAGNVATNTSNIATNTVNIATNTNEHGEHSDQHCGHCS